MPFAAALSTAPTTQEALGEILAQLRLDFAPDLAMVFFTPHHAREAGPLTRQLVAELRPRALLGCIAEGVIANDREVESTPALSVWLAKWKKPVRITPFHLSMERTADGPGLFGWPDELGSNLSVPNPKPFAKARSAVLLLGDPYSFPVDAFLARVNDEAPGVPVFGGMASGIREPGKCKLLQDGKVEDLGAVGVLLEGNLGLRSIVSQGCRPIGQPMVITKAEENVILELGGQTPFDRLRDLWDTLTPEEQSLFQNGLHIGRVLNEYQAVFQRGDFLVRNVLGLERETGSLSLTDHVRVGQTVQFQVRDAKSAEEDLHALLQMDLHAHEQRPAGALLFSCNGRGTRLFQQANHDASAIRQETGTIPLAGFFAMGELGPVGGQNFVHGFTASVVLFEE